MATSLSGKPLKTVTNKTPLVWESTATRAANKKTEAAAKSAATKAKKAASGKAESTKRASRCVTKKITSNQEI